MARILVVLVLIAGAAWYYFVGGRKIEESHVREAYSKYFEAFDAEDSKSICDLFDRSFTATTRTMGPAGPVEAQGTRAEACAGMGKFQEMKSTIQQRTGMEMHFNVEYTVTSIEIAKDGKTATAHVDSEIRVGNERGALLTIKESQTDKLIRRLGDTKFISSDGVVTMR